MRRRINRSLTFLVVLMAACLVATGAHAAGHDGDHLTASLWAKAVLDVPGSPVTLVWKMVGADITPSGDQVVSGYFYADPADFAYGSVYNPEVFVKIYIAANGWANIAFNHVTVDPVTVYSALHYAGSATQTGTTTLSNRLVEHTTPAWPSTPRCKARGDPPPPAAMRDTPSHPTCGPALCSSPVRPGKPDLESGGGRYDPQRRQRGQRLFLRQPR